METSRFFWRIPLLEFLKVNMSMKFYFINMYFRSLIFGKKKIVDENKTLNLDSLKFSRVGENQVNFILTLFPWIFFIYLFILARMFFSVFFLFKTILKVIFILKEFTNIFQKIFLHEYYNISYKTSGIKWRWSHHYTNLTKKVALTKILVKIKDRHALIIIFSPHW